MAEVYPYKAPGQWAGSDCTVKTCTNYARFLALVVGERDVEVPTCGHHLSPVTKGLYAMYARAVVVQEIPGPWRAELVVHEGRVVSLAPADRKREQ